MTHENATERKWFWAGSITGEKASTLMDENDMCVLCCIGGGNVPSRHHENLILAAVNSYDAAQAMAEMFEEMTDLAEIGTHSKESQFEGDYAIFDKAKAALSAYRKATGEGE